MIKLYDKIETFCSYPWQRIKVSCEGDVTMCCFQQRKCLGNLLNSTLEEIWHGPVAEEVRATTLQNKLHPSCAAASCPFIHAQHKLAGQRFPVADFGMPTQLEIDLPTQHCNIGGENPSPENPACIMCERFSRFQRQEDRLNDVCAALKPYVRHLKEIHIQGVAEPFWKNRIFEIMETMDIERHKHRLMVTTVTNGTILTKEKIDRWLSLPNSAIVFSIDASTPATYKAIRQLDLYDRVVGNLMTVAARRTPTQRLKIHNNINILNVGEVVGMVQVGARAKVDVLEFNPTYFTPHIEVNAGNAHLFAEAQKRIREAAASLKVPVVFLRDLALDFLVVHPDDLKPTLFDLPLA